MATQLDARMIRDLNSNIISTITNFLDTENININNLNVNSLSSNNLITLTTNISALSSDGITPFVMNFTNGLLTSINF
jgi:glycine cleavage system regulatory protein